MTKDILVHSCCAVCSAYPIEKLRELGYNEINESNAKEVLEKIAEIQSRKV